MSAVKGVNRTLADNAIPENRLARGTQDGRLKVMVDTYEALALETGSIIQMGSKLPKGARVHEVILHTDNMQNAITLAVGDEEVAARYITATTHGSAETITRTNTIIGRDYVIDETTPSTSDRQIIITTGNGAATGTIELRVEYSQD